MPDTKAAALKAIDEALAWCDGSVDIYNAAHEAVAWFEARISEQEVELERYRSALGVAAKHQGDFACIAVRDKARAALTPTTQDQSESSGEG